VSDAYTCYCTPFIKRFEQKLDRNKRDLVKHLESTHGKLATRLSHLERKTRDQISNLSNSMKETIAQVCNLGLLLLREFAPRNKLGHKG
jgi:hypothetical protein